MVEPIHRYSLEGVPGEPDIEITWTQADQIAALDEGWYLDEEDGALQADPDAKFPRVGQLLFDYVRGKASTGDELHLRAMIFDAWATVGAWERRYRETGSQEHLSRG